MSRKKLSIVVPVYFNEANLPDTVPQLLALGERLPDMDLELVFVDDGSGDRSLEILLDFQRRHPDHLRVVKLTRNFGSMAAIQAGLEAATGDCASVISADLQDPPELILEMVTHWRNGVKTVLGVRSDREESLGQRMFAGVYYSLMRRYAMPGYPEGGFDFILIDRCVIDELRRAREKNTNIMSLVFWLGHRPTLIPYFRRKRKGGKSRWTLAKKMKLFIDSFVAFSYVPVRLLSSVGVLLALASFIYGLIVLIFRLTHGTQVPGWTALILLIAFTSGVQMIMIGVIGEYVWRTLDAARQRPPYVVDQVFEGAALTARASSPSPQEPASRLRAS